MLGSGNIIVLAGLLIGLLYGAVGLVERLLHDEQPARLVGEGDSRLMRTYALALEVAIAATQLLAARGVVDLGKSIYLQPSFSVPLMFFGGLLFGYGMVLSNGCGSRALVLLGRGNLRSFVVVIVLGIICGDDAEGADCAGSHRDAATVADRRRRSSRCRRCLATLGLTEAFARTLAASVIAGALIIFAFAHAPFLRSWGQIAAGVAIGLVGCRRLVYDRLSRCR